MLMFERKNSVWLVTAFGLHVIILMLSSMMLRSLPASPVIVGEADALSMRAYVYQAPQPVHPPQPAAMRTSVAPATAVASTSAPVAADGVPQKKPVVLKSQPPRAQKAQAPAPTQARASAERRPRGEQVAALLALLHAAIQRHQQYPESAQALARQGRATVSFTLHPDGRAQYPAVVKSSGTHSLDSAALAAVCDAAPFAGVNQYLHQATIFSVDVVFELDD